MIHREDVLEWFQNVKKAIQLGRSSTINKQRLHGHRFNFPYAMNVSEPSCWPMRKRVGRILRFGSAYYGCKQGTNRLLGVQVVKVSQNIHSVS